MTKDEGNTRMDTPGYVKLPVPEHLYLRALAAVGSLAESEAPLRVEHEVAVDDGSADRIRELEAEIAALREQVDSEHRAALHYRRLAEQVPTFTPLPGGLAYYDALIGQAAERAQELDGDESYPDFGVEDDRAAAMGLPAQTTATWDYLPGGGTVTFPPEPEATAEAPAQPDGVAPPPTEAPRVTEQEGLPSLVELRQALTLNKKRLTDVAKALGMSLSTFTRGFGTSGRKLTPQTQADFHRKLAAYVAKLPQKVEPTAAPVPTMTDRGVRASATVLDDAMDVIKPYWDAMIATAGPGDYITGPDLRAGYEEWRKTSGAPEQSDRRLGLVFTALAARKAQLSKRDEAGKKPIAYYGIRWATERERNERQTADLRATIQAAKGAPREEVKDEPAVTPFVVAKKAAPKREPILAIKNASDRPGQDFAGVRVIKADGKVTWVDAGSVEVDAEPEAKPIAPEDADAQSFDLWTDYKSGYDKKFTYLPEVAALEGLDRDEIETTLRKPQHVEIRPESRDKGYPVLGFIRGDVKVILGFRDRGRPAVIAAYWQQLRGADTYRVNRHGGGGSRASQGLPSTVQAAVKQLRQKGLCFPEDWERATQPIEVTYEGQTLGKMKVHLANKQQVQGDYQRLLRQAHAIDRRKESVRAG